MTLPTQKQWDIFQKSLLHIESYRLERFDFQMNHFLHGCSIKDKTILDIGAGTGLMTIWMALNGAQQVMAVDPEGDGATTSATSILEERIKTLELQNVTFMPIDIISAELPKNSFDMIVSSNTINHIKETDRHLDADPRTRKIYQSLMIKFSKLLRPGGTIILSDCSRYNVSNLLNKFGMQHPFSSASCIRWKTHQNPSTWASLLNEAGFSNVAWRWHVPYEM